MPSYQIRLHQKAEKNLRNAPERVTTVLQEIASERQPTNHPKCSILSNNQRENLYKIKIGQWRAIGKLEKPHLNIIKLGQRQGMYDNIEELYADL